MSQADAILLQLEMEATTRQEEETANVSILIAQLEPQTNAQMEKEPADLTFTYENVEYDIHQETLPSIFVHVLEEIDEAEDEIQDENANGDSAKLHQQASFDAMTLEHSAQVPPKPIETTSNSCDDVNDVSAIPVRDVSIQHQEILVSKNVQSDLDLWARIREYDQRMVDEGFTQVLSKKQQQVMKKHVLGKSFVQYPCKGYTSFFSMNLLYWNIRGICNFESKIALRNLFMSHKPLIIFIAEPKISFEHVPSWYWNSIGVLKYCPNARENMMPNLWALWGNDVSSTILFVYDQCIVLEITCHQ